MMGFMTGGPLGAMFGMAVGNSFDEHIQKFWSQQWSFSLDNNTQSRQIFLQALFASLGKVSKSDGRITEIDIAFAELVMTKLKLNPGDKASAKTYFKQGKEDAFNVYPLLKELKNKCNYHSEYLGLYISILLQNSYHGREASAQRLKTSKDLCKRIGLSELQFEQIHSQFRKSWNQQRSQRSGGDKLSTSGAYKTLGLKQQASMQEVKRAYRKLMSQHHPDKQVALQNNHPKIEAAKEKTQSIQAAYDHIKKEKQVAAEA